MSTTTSDAAGPRDRNDHDTRFFGQPWALAHIFGVEMWERFSFYGMQGILLIYMYYSVARGGLGIDEAWRPASSARTAAPCTSRRSWAPGSPTGSSAPSVCFLSVALGTAIAGSLAKLYDPADQVPYFSTIGAVAIAMGIALLLAVKPVLALMRGVR